MAALSAPAFAALVWGAVGLVLATFAYVLWAVLGERGEGESGEEDEAVREPRDGAR